MTTQIIDLGTEHAQLESYFVSSGFWGNPELRERHGFTLSPSAYMLTSAQTDELQRLARTTHRAVYELNGRLVAHATGGQHLSHHEAGFLKRANLASRGLLRPCDGVATIPPVLKVDLVQDISGHFKIVEVDSYNPRGFGYAALLERSLPDLQRKDRFPGVERVASMIRKSSSRVKTWFLLVSEFERYYETSARIFVCALQDLGVSIDLVREVDLHKNPGHRMFTDSSVGVLVIPDSLDQYPDVRESLVAQYRKGKLATFFPPLSYLGSKGFLPDLYAARGMDEFIPRTTLVGRRHGAWRERVDLEKPLVLKATVSSGMKKVLFSDLDPEDFERTLNSVSKLPGSSWILQEQVKQCAIPATVFDPHGNRVREEHYLRITAYVSADGVVDAEVTGRPDRKVHGAPDCIQIPVILA